MAPAVIAHRGASAYERENTVAAFRAARRLGAAWVELDVRRTADGTLAVHHDAHLADGRPVASLARGDLPDHIPDLATALAACEGMAVNVEVKPHDDLAVVDAVVRVIREWGGGVLVSSFQAELVERIRRDGRDIPTALLVYGDPWSAVDSCAEAGHQAFHPWDPTVDAELVAHAHALGLEVNVWTVDDPDRMGALAAMGVDGIVTNVPDVAVAALRG